jgi:hypothetical protein
VDNGYEIAYIYGINRYYADMRRDDAKRIIQNFIDIGWKERLIKVAETGAA